MDYSGFGDQFYHLEDDTIKGVHHKSVMVTLLERLSTVIAEIRRADKLEKSKPLSMNSSTGFRVTCTSPSPSTVARNFQIARQWVIRMMFLSTLGLRRPVPAQTKRTSQWNAPKGWTVRRIGFQWNGPEVRCFSCHQAEPYPKKSLNH